MFPNGVGEYVNLMEELIPEMKSGRIRTALDTGCGVGDCSDCSLHHLDTGSMYLGMMVATPVVHLIKPF